MCLVNSCNVLCMSQSFLQVGYLAVALSWRQSPLSLLGEPYILCYYCMQRVLLIVYWLLLIVYF